MLYILAGEQREGRRHEDTWWVAGGEGKVEGEQVPRKYFVAAPEGRCDK